MADRRSLTRRFGLVAIVLVPLLAIAVGEGVLRVLWPQPAAGLPAWAFEERGGLAYLRAGVRVRHLSSEFDVEVRGSALGYRAEVGDDDPAGALWLFGDSIAFGWGVSSRETASARLTRAGRRVLNLAMPGDGLPEYLGRMRALVAAGRRPSGVVVVVYDNDLIPREAVRSGPSELAMGLQATARRAASTRLRSSLVQLHVVRLAWRSLRAAGLGAITERVSGLRAQYEGLLREELSVHRRGYVAAPEFSVHVSRLRELAAAAKAVGADMCVVRVAAYWTSGGAETPQVLRELRARLEDFDFTQLDRALSARLQAEGICYARYPSGFRAEDYFAFDRHLTATGHAGLAQLLGELALRATRPRASAAPAPGRG